MIILSIPSRIHKNETSWNENFKKLLRFIISSIINHSNSIRFFLKVKIAINMCMYTYIHMTSKNISITEDVYNKLLKIKHNNESFSELFLRLLKIQKSTLEKSFGTWNLSETEKKEIWVSLSSRNARNWNKSNLEDFK